MRGFSDAYGSWKTIWISRRTGRIGAAVERGDVPAVEDDRAGGRLEQLDDRPAERRLAAARLTDDTERLAPLDRQIDAVDGAHRADRVLEDAGLDREVLDQALDAEQRVVVAHHVGRRAGSAVRSPLPSVTPRLERGRPGDDVRLGQLLGEVAARSVVGASPIGAAPGSPSGTATRPCESAQRGWNAQPGGGVIRLGGWPGIGCSHSWSTSSRARLFIRPTVYGCRGSLKIVKTSPSSTTRPAYMTTTRSASSAIRPRSCVIRMIAACVSSLRRLQHLDDLRLDRHVERGRRLVGDEHARVVRDRHRDHRALAHAARELVRVLVDTALGVRDADELEQLDRALPRRAVGSCRRCARSPPRRSGRRPSAPGSATSSGPGRSSPCRRRGSRAARFCDSFSRSRPLKIASPLGSGRQG